MADVNSALALNIQQPNIDLTKTLGTLAQLQMAQAHSALYGAQAHFQNMRLNALQSGDINQLAAVDPELAKKAVDFRQGMVTDRVSNSARAATAFLADPTE